jgi:hypothetical protein
VVVAKVARVIGLRTTRTEAVAKEVIRILVAKAVEEEAVRILVAKAVGVGLVRAEIVGV